MLPELERERAGDHPERSLGTRVEREARPRNVLVDARHVHDRAALAALLHRPCRGRGEQERALHVDREDVVEVLRVELERGLRRRDASVVDEHVEPAELLHGLPDETLVDALFLEVADEPHRLASRRQSLVRLPRLVPVVPRVEREPEAVGLEPLGHSQPDSTVGARDERDPLHGITLPRPQALEAARRAGSAPTAPRARPRPRTPAPRRESHPAPGRGTEAARSEGRAGARPPAP